MSALEKAFPSENAESLMSGNIPKNIKQDDVKNVIETALDEDRREENVKRAKQMADYDTYRKTLPPAADGYQGWKED